MHRQAAPLYLDEVAPTDFRLERRAEEPPEVLFRPPGTILALAWFIRLSAAINFLCALIHPTKEALTNLSRWVPFEVAQNWPIRMLLVSALLFILASGLARGKRVVWLLTMATLAITPLLHIGPDFNWVQVAINGGLIALLLSQSRYFVIRSDDRAVRMALIVCPALIVSLLIFGSIELYRLRFETSGGDDWFSCIQTAFELVLAHHSVTQHALTAGSLQFFSLLRVGGTSVALAGLLLVLQPVLLRHHRRTESRERARLLIDQHGGDSLDPYALLHDKSYFFSANGRSAVPYVVSGKFAIALADPIGPATQRAQAVSEFSRFCRLHDWDAVFYEISEEMLPVYRDAEYQVFKIGEEACVRADEFHLRGAAYQNLRTARNSARRRNLTFHWYDPSAAIDEKLERQLAAISARWLEGKHALEMTFDMGSFSLEDIRRHGAAVALDPQGRAIAFATWRPFHHGRGRALDMMRSLPHVRNVMDFVLVESILHFRGRGVNEISLGNAPLANAQGDGIRLQAEERVVRFLFENLNRIYGYKSLFEFKRKYRPHWRGRYIAYRRGTPLPLVGLALVRVHAPEGLLKFFFH